jgi:molybdenum cofactor synthesis domain-containing protein
MWQMPSRVTVTAGYSRVMVRTAILTVSDSGAGDESEDRAAQAIRQVLKGGPFVEVDYQSVQDQQAPIRAKLRVWCDQGNVDLILTTGGVGLGKKDRTPEATAEVIEREVPGLPEAMRAALAKDRPLAVLSRGLAGVRRSTLIVNLPPMPDAASSALAAVITALAFAVEELRGEKVVPPAG